MFKEELTIEEILDSKIPGIKILVMANNAHKVALEYHNRLRLLFSPGEKVELIIAPKEGFKPQGEYCGNTFLYSIKNREDKKIALFSIGGLILRIESREENFPNGLEISKEYSFCIKRPRSS